MEYGHNPKYFVDQQLINIILEVGSLCFLLTSTYIKKYASEHQHLLHSEQS